MKREPTLGEIRDRIIELVDANDKNGFTAYIDEQLFAVYEHDIDPTGGLARDLRGLVWAVAKGKGWTEPR